MVQFQVVTEDGDGASVRVVHGARQGRLAVEKDLYSEQVKVERKTISFELKENPRGRFLKVTEDVGGRRDAIIIPATGLDLLREALDHVIRASVAAGPCETGDAE